MEKKIDFILILIGFYIIPIDSSYVHDQMLNNKNLIVLTKKDNNLNIKNQFFNNNNNNIKNYFNNNNISKYQSKNSYFNKIKSDSLIDVKNNNTKLKIKRYKRDQFNDKEYKKYNYYYEEQNPLVILPSEAGSIGIKNFVENLNKNNKNNYLTTTPSTFQLNEMSSMNNDEYYDEYESSEHNDNGQYNKEYDTNESSNYKENNLGSVMSQAKNLWDIYNAFNTAWSVIEQLQSNNNKNDLKKNPNENLINSNHSSNTESVNNFNLISKNSNNFGNLSESSIDRTKRNSNNTKNNNFNFTLTKRDTSNVDSAVGEGRYIKGDPLKGYYDFVITEGSYKFWAAFQLATAVLIIYSTFAAIYYSKVNPLVGDYDYVDYLGGGRSLSDDSDFVDDNSDNMPYSKSKPTSNLNEQNNYSLNKLIPNFGHSIKFILESIDKLPHNE